MKNYAGRPLGTNIMGIHATEVSPRGGYASGRQRATRGRRKGQALILAVLLMIFAALLGASFITVVSVNLNQTSRAEDRSQATVAAAAGVDYVNQQLTYSPTGARWFDTEVAGTIPGNLDASYSTYFNAVDQAQGWAGNFAKYPDPREVTDNSPQFLFKVEQIPYDINTLGAGHPLWADRDKPGFRKITVIGLSPEDPAAYERRVAFKGANRPSTPGASMLTVTNWDFTNEIVPFGFAAAFPAATTTTFSVAGGKGAFPDPPFTVTLGGPSPGLVPTPAVTSAVVTGRTNTATGADLTLALALPSALTTGTRVELAANLGSPSISTVPAEASRVDFNNDKVYSGVAVDLADAATFTAPNENVVSRISQDLSVPGSIWVNGGLVFSGNSLAQGLRSNADAYTTTTTLPPGGMRASGLIATEATAQVAVQAATSMAAPIPIAASDATNFPTGTTDLVEDGWNKLAGDEQQTGRQVVAFAPPNISSGKGLERYRTLTRFSVPNSGALVGPSIALSGAGALYGMGHGLYLDNAEDREKVTDGPSLRDMTIAELQTMWLSPPTVTTNYTRLGTPAATSTTASLEEQHIRGWVSPQEFVPRGALVEINAGGTISITRDARDDNPTASSFNYAGPVLAKAWKEYSGGGAGNPVPGLYTRTFNWPLNGVIFAEGNVRVRGVTATSARSLTIVSMNNIYIEGSVSVGTTNKLLLMARKNVVMNPTRVLASMDNQTVVTTGTAVVPTLDVADGTQFEVGEMVEVVDQNNPATRIFGLVTATAAQQLTLNFITSGSPAPGNYVRTVAERRASAGTVRWAEVAKRNEAVQRRYMGTPMAGTPTTRLFLVHSADRKAGMNVSTEVVGTQPPFSKPDPIWMSVKRPATFLPTDTNVASTSKPVYMQTTHPDLTVTEFFPAAATGLETMAEITGASPGMSGTVHDNGIDKSYRYVANPSTAVGFNYTAVPWFYLAGVGNRYEPGATTIPADLRENISTAAFESPLATSIQIVANGLQQDISNWSYDGTDYRKVRQFGFNPTYQDTPAVPATYLTDEDVLTVDKSFYQTGAALRTADSRSLEGVTLDTLGPLVFRQSDGISATIDETNASLPAYRLYQVKVEDITDNGTGAITAVNPGAVLNVNAFVYAQEGSWFVIPGDKFNPSIKIAAGTDLTYQDFNDNDVVDAGEYYDANGSISHDTGDFADMNRNGVQDVEEQLPVIKARIGRYNYQINFTGAIMQNRTPLVNDVPSTTVKGAVRAWTDTTATIAYDSTAAEPYTYQTITYTYDPAVAQGAMDNENGFIIPRTPDLIYQG